MDWSHLLAIINIWTKWGINCINVHGTPLQAYTPLSMHLVVSIRDASNIFAERMWSKDENQLLIESVDSKLNLIDRF